MAINLDGVSKTQYVNFSTVSAVTNLATKSICFWVYQDAYISQSHIVELWATAGTQSSWVVNLNWTNNGDIMFAEAFNNDPVNPGEWRTTAGGYALTGGWHHVCITYDRSAAANDPLIYADGVAVGTTEIITPAGVANTGTGATVYIGGDGTNYFPIDGKISDVRVYNRILTPAEVLDMYNRRSMNDNINGLVFNPVLYGAAACQAFDGTALATAHKIVDPYSGAIGTPSGSPVGAGETYLTVCP
jgi:hypothetical protein